jgi:NADH-quinone oxidoreductase subunit I
MKMERPTLTFWDKLYIPQILRGLWITLKHLPRRKITRQYPEVKPRLQGPYRGVPTLVRNEAGQVKCVACQLCEFVCPPRAIRVTPGVRADAPPEAKIEKEPQEFEIDMLRCIYCGLCEEVCPEEAIFLKKDFAVTGYSREDLVLRKDQLLALGGVQASPIAKWKDK